MQSLYIKGSAGDPLPQVWEAFPTRFLRGQLGLISAAPGIGKSAFILTYALLAQVPTLYLSADSDPFTQLSRMVSILNGWTIEKSSIAVREGDLGDAEAALEGLPIRFNYNASPSLDQLELAMMSYEEVYGDYPSMVVIDNITNVQGIGGGEDDPFSGLESMMDYLHDMARKTAAFVVGLHHVQGKYNDGNIPIPLSGIKGQIARVPEQVLTLHRLQSEFGSDKLNVSTVKNRGGRSDPSGLTFAELEFIGDSMTIRDFSTAPGASLT